MKIRALTKDDWSAVAAIYKEGLDTEVATFETEIPSWEQWDVAHISSCRLVAEKENMICGWAALSPVSRRKAYKGVAEVSIYIAASGRGLKVGQRLLYRLISESEKAGFWTLQAGIFSENKVSIALHQKMGFRMIGFREKVASRNGKWHDNCLLERRSKIIGIK
ncbi:GNAT family N-acetyltransferase [Spongiivirga citrea]|nr:GNAT family N-acetyltransferase [Spongiivirga citrea]